MVAWSPNDTSDIAGVVECGHAPSSSRENPHTGFERRAGRADSMAQPRRGWNRAPSRQRGSLVSRFSLRRLALGLILIVAASVGLALWFGTVLAVVNGLDTGAADLEYGRDLRAFATAGSLAAEGRAEALYDSSDPAYQGAAAFVNPPWYALLMMPIGGVAFVPLWFGWTIAGVGTLFVSLRALGVQRWATIAALSMLSVSAVFTVYFGQNSLFMAGLLTITMLWMLSGSQVAAGLGLAALGFKPHLLIGFAVLALLDIRRWRRLLVTVVSATVVLVVVSALALPGSWAEFINALSHPESLVDPEREVSIIAGLRLLFGTTGPLAVGTALVGAIVVLAGFAHVVRRQEVDRGIIALTVVVSLLVAPHALAYDWMLLVPALALLLVHGAVPPRTLFRWSAGLAAAVAIGPTLSRVQLDALGVALHLPPAVLLAFAVWLAIRLDERPVAMTAP